MLTQLVPLLAIFLAQGVQAIPSYDTSNANNNLGSIQAKQGSSTHLGLVRTMFFQDLPKVEGPVNRQSAKVLRQDVKKRLQQLAAAENTNPALYDGGNQGTWETEKAEYQNRLNTIEANCNHCEAKEGDLDTAYATAGDAHTRVNDILTQINLVSAAQVLYDQDLGMTGGGGNGFNQALEVLKGASNGFNDPLAHHTSSSSDLQPVPSNLQQLVNDVNTKALAVRNQLTALQGAKSDSVNSGLCQQSGGGVNEECTLSHLDRAGGARLAAIDADAAVVTAKGARDTACSVTSMNAATTNAATSPLFDFSSQPTFDTPSGLTSTRYRVIKVAPNNQIALTSKYEEDRRIWRSSDGLQSFAKLDNSPERTVDLCLADDDSVYYALAGFEGSQTGIHKSIDQGGTWVALTDSLVTGQINWQQMHCSADGVYIIAVANNPLYGGGLYVSSDSGDSFTKVQSFVDEGIFNFIAIKGSADAKYAILTAYNSKPLWTTSDFGATWSYRLADEVSSSSMYSNTAIASSRDGKYMVAQTGTSTTIYKSTDFGASFATVTGPPAASWRAAAISDDGTQIAFGQNGGSMYTSSDSGASWATVSQFSGSIQWFWFHFTNSIFAAVSYGGTPYVMRAT